MNRCGQFPPSEMKRKREQLVPLSDQAVAVLKELELLTGRYEYILASTRKTEQPISNNTLLFGLYRLGYHSRATGHGFRTTASTTLNEMGFNPDAIERQLAMFPGIRLGAFTIKPNTYPKELR